MDELTALDVTAVRALEICDRTRTLWTDADRAWASRAAAEVVGENADGGTFLGRRAQLALEHIGERHKELPRAVRALRWRPWVAWMVVAAAFVIGLAADRIGSAQRVNLLAPPVIALLVWNLGVYAALAGGYLVRYGAAGRPGPMRALVIRVAGRTARIFATGLGARGDGSNVVAMSIAALTAEWARLAAPLYAQRAARILHQAAVALALGLIAGLYVRGLALEYRATWESTFLDSAKVHALLTTVLAPGSFATGIPVPGLAQVDAIRAPASENAATWLHLLAASVLMIVVVPRLTLAVGAGFIERHRAARIAVPMAEPYFQRLLRGFRGGPVRVRVIPYSYTVPAAALAGLEAIVARVFGGSAALTVESPVTYGDEDTVASRMQPGGQGPVIALFNLTATPEREVHGAFVTALAARIGPAQPLLAIVDESAFRERWPGDDKRLAERQAIWDELLAAAHVKPSFVNLAGPDLPATETALEAALTAHEAHERGVPVPP